MLLHLDLSDNRLTTVDGAFAGLRQLSRLDLRNNRLTEITQFTFRDQLNLRYLLLSHLPRDPDQVSTETGPRTCTGPVCPKSSNLIPVQKIGLERGPV